MKTLTRVAVGAVFCAAAIGTAGAQLPGTGNIVVTPYVGLYTPATDIAKMSIAGAGGSLDAALKHQVSPAVGVTASYWLGRRTALEVGGVYASSDVKGDLATVLGGSPTVASYSAHANVWMFSTRFLVHLLPEESPVSLRLGFGPAVVTRNGSAYKDSQGKVTGLTDVGGALSLCSRIELMQNLGLRLRAEDYVYSAKLGFQSKTNPSDNFTFDSKTQHDFVFSAGLQFFLNR